MVLLALALAAVIGYRGLGKLASRAAEERHERARGWAILYLLVLAFAVLAGRILATVLRLAELLFGRLTGDFFLFLVTFFMACVGFYGTYLTVAEIHLIRGRAPADHRKSKQFVWAWIVVPFTFVSVGVSLLFARPGKPFFVCPLGSLSGWFDPDRWGGTGFWPALLFGLLVGLIRAAFCSWINLKARYRIYWRAFEREARALSALWSGLISGAGLAAVLSWLSGLGAAHPGGPGAVMMSFGPALVMIAMGAGSAIEVGLIGGYRQEGMREWRASLGAYLLMIGTLWTVLCVLSIYGPLVMWWAGSWAAWATGAGLVVISMFGAMADRSERNDGVKTRKSWLDYLALIAPPMFLIGLVVAGLGAGGLPPRRGHPDHGRWQVPPSALQRQPGTHLDRLAPVGVSGDGQLPPCKHQPIWAQRVLRQPAGSLLFGSVAAAGGADGGTAQLRPDQQPRPCPPSQPDHRLRPRGRFSDARPGHRARSGAATTWSSTTAVLIT